MKDNKKIKSAIRSGICILTILFLFSGVLAKDSIHQKSDLLTVRAETTQNNVQPDKNEVSQLSDTQNNNTTGNIKEESHLLPDLDPFANGGCYSTILYNNTNGLPTSESNTITQTNEGFIWIGSYGGLVRYDGIKFERIKLDHNISGIKTDSGQDQ